MRKPCHPRRWTGTDEESAGASGNPEARYEAGHSRGRDSAMQALIPCWQRRTISSSADRPNRSGGASAGGRGRRFSPGLDLRPRWTQMRRGQAFGSPGASAQLQPSLLYALARGSSTSISLQHSASGKVGARDHLCEAMMELGTQLDNVTTIANSGRGARRSIAHDVG